MLKEVAGFQFRGHFVNLRMYVSAKQQLKGGGVALQPGERRRALQPECRLHVLVPALGPGFAYLCQSFVNPPPQPLHCSLCPSVVDWSVVDGNL